MTVKCLLIKDKPAPTRVLNDFIEKTGTLKLLATAANTDDAVLFMNKTIPDIVFLSKQQLQQLKKAGFSKEKPPVYICITDEEHHNGFDSTHGILTIGGKKLNYESFLNIVNRAIVELMGWFFSTNNNRDETYLFIKSEYRIIKVNYNDILFCEGLKDYTQIYTSRKSKPIITLQNLKTFSDKLPPKSFVRIHRSYIISLNHIESISKKEVEIGEKTLPIGNSYRNNLLDIVRQNS